MSAPGRRTPPPADRLKPVGTVSAIILLAAAGLTAWRAGTGPPAAPPLPAGGPASAPLVAPGGRPLDGGPAMGVLPGGNREGKFLAGLVAFLADAASWPEEKRAAELAQWVEEIDRHPGPLDPGEICGLLELLAEAGDESLNGVHRALFRRLAASEPRTAVALAERLPAGTTREIMRLQVALAWAEEDLPAAAAWLDGWSDTAARRLAYQSFGILLAEIPADRAEAWLATFRPTEPILGMFQTFLMHGGDRALQATLAWAQRLPEGAAKDRVFAELAHRWERRDFQSALAFAQRRPEGADGLMKLLASLWVRRDPSAAASWAAAHASTRQGEQLVGSLTSAWAQTDPRAAAEFVWRSLPPGSARDAAAISVVSAWAARDPAAAAEWVDRLAAGPTAAYAVDNIVSAWAAKDSLAAIAWLDRRPAGASRDAALQTGYLRASSIDPRLALLWAQAMDDPQARETRTEQAARGWLAVDPAAAARWIAASTLPFGVKQRLVQPTP